MGTRENAEPMVCQREGDGCGVFGGHDSICDACHSSRFDFVLVLISFYMVVIGLVGLLTACGSPLMRGEFGFVRSRFGRGFLMFFIGTLACAQGMNFTYVQYVTLVVGIIDTSIGALLMLSYLCVASGQVHQKQLPTGRAQMYPPRLHDAEDKVALPALPYNPGDAGVVAIRDV